MDAPELNILIADDHELIREGLKRILLDGKIARKVGEAHDAAQAIAAVRQGKWDVVILDINLGGRSGLEALKEIKAEFPRLPVLILSTYPEEQFALRTIRAGANGYLNKNLASDVLVEAVRQVRSGGRYVSPKVAEQLMNAVQRPDGQPLHLSLSAREDQVMRFISSGRTVGEVAEQLNLSVKTVSTYRGKILGKLGLENNAQIMRYAQEHGLGDWGGGGGPRTNT